MLDTIFIVSLFLSFFMFIALVYFRDMHRELTYKYDELQESYDTILDTIDEESAPLAVIAAKKWEVRPRAPKWYVGGEEGNTLLEAYQKACRVHAARIVN